MEYFCLPSQHFAMYQGADEGMNQGAAPFGEFGGATGEIAGTNTTVRGHLLAPISVAVFCSGLGALQCQCQLPVSLHHCHWCQQCQLQHDVTSSCGHRVKNTVPLRVAVFNGGRRWGVTSNRVGFEFS